MSRAKLIACIYLCLTAPLAAEPRSDFVIEPGERAGIITKDATESSLRALLPEGQMKRVFHPIGEGFFRCGTEVYSGTTDVVVVEWATIDKEYDEESEANIRECMDFPPPSHPRLVRIDRGLSDKPESSWRTTQGLQLGNSIRKVERLAGAPFMISICGCDTGGETDLEENPHFKKLGIRIGFPYEDAETLYERLPEGGHDAAILSSDVPNSMAHHFIVNEMIVVIDE